MDIREYISSGAVESYVLGLASPEECLEFEKLCDAYPELQAARESFELSLEKQILGDALQPPARLKGSLMARIDMEKDQQPAQTATAPKKPLPRIRPIWTRLVAACLLMLLGISTVLNFYFFNKYKEYVGKYDRGVERENLVQADNNLMKKRLLEYESALKMIKDPGMSMVKLPGAPHSPSPSSMATVYWDNRSRQVYLLVNNLPMPSAGKQYQLWAMVNGKPVDAGVFDMNLEMPVMKMKDISQAEAFAITLEKKGGSLEPTMDALYVMGKVAG